MNVMLEVAIGLVFVYLVLSLLASAVAEAMEHLFHYRADYLRQGIEKLLLAGNLVLRERLYQHPLIKSLYTPSRLEHKFLRAGGPAYIPSRQFVLALLDIVSAGATPLSAGATAGGGAGETTAGTASAGEVKASSPTAAAELLTAIKANPAVPAQLQHALQTLISDAGGDIEKVKANVQEWFDGSMDRVAGWYKRRAQFVLLFIGAFAAVGVNADTITIVRTLSNDSAVRAVVVTAAETYVRDNPRPESTELAPAAGQTPVAPGAPGNATPNGPVPLGQVTEDVRKSVQAVSKQLGTLGLPVGWREYDPAIDAAAVAPLSGAERKAYLVENRVWPQSLDEWPPHFFSHLLGWLLTAIAISFGAPFWFDTLNKIMVIRSTVKPREKSRDEGSEDRQPAGRTQPVRIEIAGASR